MPHAARFPLQRAAPCSPCMRLDSVNCACVRQGGGGDGSDGTHVPSGCVCCAACHPTPQDSGGAVHDRGGRCGPQTLVMISRHVAARGPTGQEPLSPERLAPRLPGGVLVPWRGVGPSLSPQVCAPCRLRSAPARDPFCIKAGDSAGWLEPRAPRWGTEQGRGVGESGQHPGGRLNQQSPAAQEPAAWAACPRLLARPCCPCHSSVLHKLRTCPKTWSMTLEASLHVPPSSDRSESQDPPQRPGSQGAQVGLSSGKPRPLPRQALPVPASEPLALNVTFFLVSFLSLSFFHLILKAMALPCPPSPLAHS